VTTEYSDREDWDLPSWPDTYGKLKELPALILLGGAGIGEHVGDAHEQRDGLQGGSR